MGESACWNDWRAFLSEIRIALRGTYRKHVDFIVLQTNKKWLEEINDGNIPTILWRNNQLWQTVVMDTSAQRKNETDHPGGTCWVVPWFSRWRSSDSAARLVIPQLVEPATNLPSLPSNIKGFVSRIGGSASVIVELAMLGYDPFSNTPKYHCNLLDFCHIMISPIASPLPSGSVT